MPTVPQIRVAAGVSEARKLESLMPRETRADGNNAPIRTQLTRRAVNPTMSLGPGKQPSRQAINSRGWATRTQRDR